ncbi:phage tail tape measure protein [Quatrionicoccus australiensis]|uniref:hypothetical protein n=1 Tax=Quatrionicoccus australiensis TaxID=138118 RepID=UPI001CF873E1|nr:hypothetical protein [Quatrionicoccus australiensis]UCV15524.1 hypothetical protein KI612_02105 [Quatrionicoccus australiensis]
MGAAQQNEIDVRISAETSGLKPGMDGAANDVEKSTERIRQSLDRLSFALADQASKISGRMSQMAGDVKAANDENSRSFESVVESSGRAGVLIGAAFVAVSGTIAVAAKGAIDSMDDMNDAAERVGMTTEALSRLGYAAKLSGVEFGELSGAMSKMSAKMQDALSGDKAAVAWFHDVGVSVVDTSGKLKAVETVVEEVADRFSKFEDGAAKTALAVDGFGRAGARLVPLLNQGRDGMRELYDESDRLGATIGGKAAAEAGKFNDQVDRLKAQTAGAARTMVSDLLPALNEVIERFRIGQKVIGDFVGGLSMAFGGSGNAREKINSLTGELNDLLDARDRYLKSGAETSGIDTAIIAIQRKIKAYKELEVARALSSAGENYGNEGRGQMASDEGKIDIKRTPSPSPKKPEAEKSRMPAWEAGLSNIKAGFLEDHQFYEMSLADEKKYWDELLNRTDLSQQERGQIEKKASEVRLQSLRKAVVEEKGLSLEKIEEKQRVSANLVDIDQQAAEQAYDMGEINAEQLLQLDSQFEQQRYEITRKAIEERAALMQKDPSHDPVAYQKLQNQLLEIYRKYQMDKRSIEGKIDVAQAMPAKNMFASMENSFSGALTGMLTKAQTWRQALAGVYQSLTQMFVRDVVVKQGVDYAAGLLKQTALYRTFFTTKQGLDTAGAAVHASTETAKTAATVAGVTTRTTAETVASGQSVMMRLGSAISSIMISAWEAMAGAFAAMASIPYVGPFLAVGAGAAAFAAVAGIVGNLPSAAGGYDVPSGVNPITQIHEEEMVLPREHANTIRRMSGNDGGSSGGGTVHIHNHIQSWDSRDVKSFLIGNKSGLVAALKEAQRTRNV